MVIQGNIHLTKIEMKLIEFWFLSCQDKSLESSPESLYCQNCPVKKDCDKLRSRFGFK